MCTTHEAYHGVKDWKIELSNYDSFILNDITRSNGNYQGGFCYSEQDIRTNFNFPHQVSKKHYWNSYGNRNIIWFYAHFRMMNFYLANPNYDYYWFFDDDVKMNDWNKFLQETDKDDSDFISYFIFKAPGAVNQSSIPYIDSRTTSGPFWFSRFPGDGDILAKEATELFGSFFPTTRYSNEAMKILVRQHDLGNYGYSEGFVPTTLNLYRKKLKTLIKPDNTSDLFDVDEINILHKGIRINWEWI
jgi:hypothetical protein